MTAFDNAKFELSEKLLAELRRAMKAHTELTEPRIIRVSAEFPRAAILPILSTGSWETRFYWSDREGSLEILGLGESDRVFGPRGTGWNGLFEELERRLNLSSETIRYYGGIGFDVGSVEKSGENLWQDFGDYRFVLPRFELLNDRARPEVTQLACNLLLFPQGIVDEESLLADVRDLRLPAGAQKLIPFPQLSRRQDEPDFQGWDKMLFQAAEDFRSGALQKIVAARRTSLEFEASLEPVALLQSLKCSTPGCFHFFFQSGTSAFMAATPERLFKREGKRLETEALAGTRPRGKNEEMDRELEAALLSSEKDLREHAAVKDAILETLAPLVQDAQAETHPIVTRLARVQHLKTPITAELKDERADSRLVASLHPTPAVGGTPKSDAVARIREIEPFDRGWYAGCVGIASKETTELAVGIRSALVRDKELYLYTGAGIVPGSDAKSEWSEIEHKMSDYLRVLNLL